MATLRPRNRPSWNLARRPDRAIASGTRRKAASSATSLLAFGGMVLASGHSRNRDSLLSRPSTASAPRALPDPRSRGQHEARMSPAATTRSRPRHPTCFQSSSPKEMARAFWIVFGALSRLLPTQSGKSALRRPSPLLVCTKSSGRRFRRNLCSLAGTAVDLEAGLQGMAGAAETLLCR